MERSDRKVIIFDLGKVLVRESQMRVLSKFSKKSLFTFSRIYRSFTPLRVFFFDVMETIKGKGFFSVYPLIFEEWLTNKITNEEIRDVMRNAISENTLYPSSVKDLLYTLVDVTFTPEIFAEIMTLHSGANLLDLIPSDIPIYLITNYNSEACAVLMKKYPDVFSKFTDIIVSGDVKLMKPQQEIYAHAMRKWRLDNISKENILYIDDEIENIETAKSIGFKTILYNCYDEAKIVLDDFLQTP